MHNLFGMVTHFESQCAARMVARCVCMGRAYGSAVVCCVLQLLHCLWQSQKASCLDAYQHLGGIKSWVSGTQASAYTPSPRL